MLRTGSSTNDWQPKQCPTLTPEVFASFNGGASAHLAAHLVSSTMSRLAVPITKDSVVHDNACGIAVVTDAIMAVVEDQVRKKQYMGAGNESGFDYRGKGHEENVATGRTRENDEPQYVIAENGSGFGYGVNSKDSLGNSGAGKKQENNEELNMPVENGSGFGYGIGTVGILGAGVASKRRENEELQYVSVENGSGPEALIRDRTVPFYANSTDKSPVNKHSFQNNYGHGFGVGRGTAIDVVLAAPKIYCTDLAPLMISESQKLLNDKGPSWSKISVQQMGMQDLSPFEDNTFTHSYTNFAIFSLSDADATAATKHIYRTLKPGGNAWLTTYENVKHQAGVDLAHRVLRGPDAVLERRFADKWWTEEHLRKVMVEAGFEEGKVDVERVDHWMEIKDLDKWVDVAWTTVGKPKGGWKQSDEDQWEEATGIIKKSLREGESYDTRPDGSERLKVGVLVLRGTK